jgi:hypothetical protein
LVLRRGIAVHLFAVIIAKSVYIVRIGHGTERTTLYVDESGGGAAVIVDWYADAGRPLCWLISAAVQGEAERFYLRKRQALQIVGACEIDASIRP